MWIRTSTSEELTLNERDVSVQNIWSNASEEAYNVQSVSPAYLENGIGLFVLDLFVLWWTSFLYYVGMFFRALVIFSFKLASTFSLAWICVVYHITHIFANHIFMLFQFYVVCSCASM